MRCAVSVRVALTTLRLAQSGQAPCGMQAGATELLQEAHTSLDSLSSSLAAYELTRLLNGPYDSGAAVLTIQAGAGGDDASDWAEMLERMYLRWCEGKGWAVQRVDRVAGGAAGIRSADYEVRILSMALGFWFFVLCLSCCWMTWGNVVLHARVDRITRGAAAVSSAVYKVRACLANVVWLAVA